MKGSSRTVILSLPYKIQARSRRFAEAQRWTLASVATRCDQKRIIRPYDAKFACYFQRFTVGWVQRYGGLWNGELGRVSRWLPSNLCSKKPWTPAVPESNKNHRTRILPFKKGRTKTYQLLPSMSYGRVYYIIFLPLANNWPPFSSPSGDAAFNDARAKSLIKDLQKAASNVSDSPLRCRLAMFFVASRLVVVPLLLSSIAAALKDPVCVLIEAAISSKSDVYYPGTDLSYSASFKNTHWLHF